MVGEGLADWVGRLKGGAHLGALAVAARAGMVTCASRAAPLGNARTRRQCCPLCAQTTGKQPLKYYFESADMAAYVCRMCVVRQQFARLYNVDSDSPSELDPDLPDLVR